MQLALRAAELGNINAVSDAGSAAAFAKAAMEGAGLNVRINLLGLEKELDPAHMLTELNTLEKQAEDLSVSLRRVMTERGGLDLS